MTVRPHGEIGGRPVYVSEHAAARMVEMGMRPHEIELTIAHPDDTYTSKKYPQATCYRRGRFSLATRMDGEVLVIITALYGRMGDWVAAAEEGGLGDGRTLRFDTGIPK